MDFTREPIIETIITPRDGCKLVIRNSKSPGQEEYFLDAVEVVSFGHALFFRSLERPKAFLVPVNDYEILEVREARMVLKNVGPDRSIKIGGGREAAIRVATREEKIETVTVQPAEEVVPTAAEAEQEPQAAESTEARPEVRLDKKRDRRRHYRKRRGNREESAKEEETSEVAIPPLEEGERVDIPPPEVVEPVVPIAAPLSSSLLSSLLQPPPTLISETISYYRKNALFKDAFFTSEEESYKPHDKVHELLSEDDEDLAPHLQEPTYEPFEQPASPEEGIKEEGEVENEEGATQQAAMEEPGETFSFIEPSEESFEERGEPGLEEYISHEISLPLYAEEEEPVIEHDESIIQEEKVSEGFENVKKRKKEHQEDLPF